MYCIITALHVPVWRFLTGGGTNDILMDISIGSRLKYNWWLEMVREHVRGRKSRCRRVTLMMMLENIPIGAPYAKKKKHCLRGHKPESTHFTERCKMTAIFTFWYSSGEASRPSSFDFGFNDFRSTNKVT